MKVSELRKGNLINNNNQVIEILANTVTCFGLSFSGMVSFGEYEIKPIPLTEEWLVKFGFIKHEVDGRYGYIYSIGRNDYRYTIERDWNKESSHFFGIEYTDSNRDCDDGHVYNFSFDLKYVHQLQNLYQALTGEELIKNNS